MNKRLIALSAVLAVLGCQSPSTAPYAARPDPEQPPYSNPRVQLISGDLVRSLGTEKPIVTRDDDLLMVTVPLRNLSDNNYYLDYKYVFYDSKGREVRPAMGWKEIVLPPRTRRDFTANALDEKAVDWKLMIRWANR